MHPTEQAPEDIREPDSQAPDEASPEETEDAASPSWWQRLTSRVFTREEPEPSTEEPETAPAPETQARMLTDADIQRLVQSEADRREALKNKTARDAERKRLRDEDPWQLAELERQEEQAQTQNAQLDELFQGIGRAHDEVTLVPLMQALEPAEYERLMQLPGAGVGGDGRKLLTAEALKSLEKRWRAEGAKEAEAKLRKNPTFRKQVMSEFNGGTSSPELLPSGSVSRNNGRSSEQINDMLRQQVNLPTRE